MIVYTTDSRIKNTGSTTYYPLLLRKLERDKRYAGGAMLCCWPGTFSGSCERQLPDIAVTLFSFISATSPERSSLYSLLPTVPRMATSTDDAMRQRVLMHLFFTSFRMISFVGDRRKSGLGGFQRNEKLVGDSLHFFSRIDK